MAGVIPCIAFQMNKPVHSLTSIHAGGREDFIKASRANEKLRQEEIKLTRRIRRFCHARGFIGDMIVYFRKRKLLAVLRRRAGRYDSVFVAK